MDAKAQRKALFRSKLKESSQNRDKRIDSPLVRYNEFDQPVCRACNVILKSESLWAAHQASRKHHEAIESIKASAAGLTNAKKTEKPTELHKSRAPSTLPVDFFENQETKRQKSGQSIEVPESVDKTNRAAINSPAEIKNRSQNATTDKLDQPLTKMDYADAKQVKGTSHERFSEDKEAESNLSNKLSQAPQKMDRLEVKQVKGTLPDGFFDNKGRNESDAFNQLSEKSKNLDGIEPKQVKGALPEGFFDNKDADLRARGIQPVKVDVNDALKEFEKEIQDDLQGVDDRLEEEEIDAAEIREEFETLEQKVYREKVEMVKRQLLEVKAARVARGQKSPAFKGKASSDDDDDSSDEDDEDFVVDWRAKRL